MIEVPSNDTVAALVDHHRPTLGVAQIDTIAVHLIGRGEAHLNVRVTVNESRSLNLRLGLRGQESERTLRSEVDALQKIPTGIGPTPYVVDTSCTHLPQPYSLLAYVPGDLKEDWTMADLETHARMLARLHQSSFDRHGSVLAPQQATYDFVERFETALNYWQTHHPELIQRPEIQRLKPAVGTFIAKRNHLFTSLERFTVVHGDLHAQNILFNGHQVTYIDWEMTHIGDPALDVAMLGWDIKTAWQMELVGARLERFIETYQSQHHDPTLRQRREVWMIYTMFFDHIYHRTQMTPKIDVLGRHRYNVEQIERYLHERFL